MRLSRSPSVDVATSGSSTITLASLDHFCAITALIRFSSRFWKYHYKRETNRKKKQPSVPLIMTSSNITQFTGVGQQRPISVQCQKMTLFVSQYLMCIPSSSKLNHLSKRSLLEIKIFNKLPFEFKNVAGNKKLFILHSRRVP
jgi:hypothetical protein